MLTGQGKIMAGKIMILPSMILPKSCCRKPVLPAQKNVFAKRSQMNFFQQPTAQWVVEKSNFENEAKTKPNATGSNDFRFVSIQNNPSFHHNLFP